MPIYEYIAVTDSCAHCRDGFEAMRRLSDPELSHCPQCGNALRRKVSAPSIAMGGAHHLKESNVAKNGFTQYRRAGKGVYEKTAGKGPKFISGD
jgi:putative FmdB family regulatory protein